MKIQVEGMSCVNCALGIKKHLEKEGLKNVNVNFATKEASCISNDLSEEEVAKIITNLGYTTNIKKKKTMF